MKGMTAALKDRMIFAGWITGLLLIASLIWSLSFPFRSECLMRATNRILISMNDSRRVSVPVVHHFAGPVPLGCWYRMYESDSLFFVFVIMREGILVPCGAEISTQGEIVEIIPLGNHARQVMEHIPRGLIQVYARRIESAAAVITSAQSGRRKG
ncbi:MAG: hypothetical protein LBH20_10040 [Treponema sp.]|jgi:hypothetical protein|nr:hypothetical protein [Treponema sp.]